MDVPEELSPHHVPLTTLRIPAPSNRHDHISSSPEKIDANIDYNRDSTYSHDLACTLPTASNAHATFDE